MQFNTLSLNTIRLWNYRMTLFSGLLCASIIWIAIAAHFLGGPGVILYENNPWIAGFEVMALGWFVFCLGRLLDQSIRNDTAPPPKFYKNLGSS